MALPQWSVSGWRARGPGLEFHWHRQKVTHMVHRFQSTITERGRERKGVWGLEDGRRGRGREGGRGGRKEDGRKNNRMKATWDKGVRVEDGRWRGRRGGGGRTDKGRKVKEMNVQEKYYNKLLSIAYVVYNSPHPDQESNSKLPASTLSTWASLYSL